MPRFETYLKRTDGIRMTRPTTMMIVSIAKNMRTHYTFFGLSFLATLLMILPNSKYKIRNAIRISQTRTIYLSDFLIDPTYSPKVGKLLILCGLAKRYRILGNINPKIIHTHALITLLGKGSIWGSACSSVIKLTNISLLWL